MGLSQSMRSTVVLDHIGVIDGQIRHALLESNSGITECGQNARYQLVGLSRGNGWLVDEARLDARPLLHEFRFLCLRQSVELEVTDALGARRKLPVSA